MRHSYYGTTSRKLMFAIILALFPIFSNGLFSQVFGSGGSRNEPACESLNEEGKKFFLDQDSKTCFQRGTRGPCGEMMVFYQHPTSTKNGFCDCDQGYKSDKPCSDAPVRKRMYIHQHRRCFTVFSQGPCYNGYWLIMDKEGFPKCEPNKCMDQGKSKDTANQFLFYDPLREQCYTTLTQGHCPAGKTLELVHDSQFPQCQRKACFGNLVHGVRSELVCAPGSRYSYYTKSCQTTVNRTSGYRVG